MSYLRRIRWATLTAALLLTVAPSSARGQSLLIIPNLSKGVDTVVVAEIARNKFIQDKGSDTAAMRVAVEEAVQDALTPGWWDADLIGEMSPEVSKTFWGEARSGILPGSSIGLGSGHAAIYTEVGHVLSGAWRFAVGTTVAVAEDEEEEPEELEAEQEEDVSTPGLNRFMAGGGSLSLQVLRPIWLFKAGDYNRMGVIAVPRVWVNLPQLTSAENVDDYGYEAALSVLYQRHRNDSTPFLTLEMRGGVAAGSEAFYRAIGHDDASKFFYLAPTVTLSIVDQVNVGASYFWSPDLSAPGGIRLSLTLLNKDTKPEPSRATQGRNGT